MAKFSGSTSNGVDATSSVRAGLVAFVEADGVLSRQGQRAAVADREIVVVTTTHALDALSAIGR